MLSPYASSGSGGARGGAMEPPNQEKKLNDDLVVFMRKRSETDAPRYTARLKTYVDFQKKRRRAAAARKRSDHNTQAKRKALNAPEKEKTADNCDQQGDNDDQTHCSRRRGQKGQRSGSASLSRSLEPTDRCGCRRRRRRRSRRRRRRSCRRRRRRRRSCGRRRRRRRSCRRRRRRSCRRRRKRARRRCR